VPVNSPRTANSEQLAAACRAANPFAEAKTAPSLLDALNASHDHALVVITGSLYLVGEALELLGLASAAGERALNEWNPARPPK
jgi:folylpolyglutamate synthase/dihydropteroate synthase